MKAGDRVKFNFSVHHVVYAVVIYGTGDKAMLDYQNPVTQVFEVDEKPVSELVKIEKQVIPSYRGKGLNNKNNKYY